MIVDFGLLRLLVALAALTVASLVGVVQVWKPLHRTKLKGLRLVVVIAILAICSLVFVTTAAAFGYKMLIIITGVADDNAKAPTPTPPPTPTPEPTVSPYLRCRYLPDELPCLDEVLNSVPRDNLTMMAKRNYHIDGFVDPMYAYAICEANEDLLKEQFYKNIPPAEHSNWGNTPWCNYLVPGTLLIIPIPLTPFP